MIEHNSGKGAKYTRSRRPVKLAGISAEMTKSEALKLEYRIKRLPAESKISKLTKEGDKMTISKDLRAITREIKALEKTISKLAKTVEKSEKAKVAKKTTTKSAKAKTTKRAPAKKKIAKLTATDQVLKILKGRKRGVTASALMERTGFDNKKIQNILQRTYKQGKIKRVGKGMYVGI
jgi:predicted GIY-YIG superfamily endonuclease